MVARLQEAPERGDLVWLDFSPQVGHEQAGRRPALVLSPQSYNKRVGLALCCPITSHAKGYPFEVALPPDGGVTGVILADQIKSLDWRARNIKIETRTSREIIREVLAKVRVLIQ